MNILNQQDNEETVLINKYDFNLLMNMLKRPPPPSDFTNPLNVYPIHPPIRLDSIVPQSNYIPPVETSSIMQLPPMHPNSYSNTINSNEYFSDYSSNMSIFH